MGLTDCKVAHIQDINFFWARWESKAFVKTRATIGLKIRQIFPNIDLHLQNLKKLLPVNLNFLCNCVNEA